MSLATIRTKIKEILQTVSGIGQVHDYGRWTADWSKFLSAFKSVDKINGWLITRRSSTEEPFGENVPPVHHRTHEFVIEGYYSLRDNVASERDFQDLVEAICEAFRGDLTLGGTALMSEPPQVESIDSSTLGGVLVHQARIVIRATERLTS
jgi:hypothetical protein